MALFRSLLRIILLQAQTGEPAAALLERAVAFTNDYIAIEHARDNMFATVFTAILCPRSGRLDFINAGHDAPLLLRRGAPQPEPLAPEGLAVGMMDGQTHGARHTHLHKGDCLLAFTDGLPEAPDPAGRAYGEANVVADLLGHEGQPLALVQTIQDRLAHHMAGRSPHDDVTLLCLMADTATQQVLPMGRSASVMRAIGDVTLASAAR
jgi:serine phosphatase RsbU (regulator of sigma subunit)